MNRVGRRHFFFKIMKYAGRKSDGIQIYEIDRRYFGSNSNLFLYHGMYFIAQSTVLKFLNLSKAAQFSAWATVFYLCEQSVHFHSLHLVLKYPAPYYGQGNTLSQTSIVMNSIWCAPCSLLTRSKLTFEKLFLFYSHI